MPKSLPAANKDCSVSHSTLSIRRTAAPDQYLYIGVGDGGSANDPPNNAQNVNVLLGKILRFDVSAPGTYSSPPTNPFFGATPGADEISHTASAIRGASASIGPPWSSGLRTSDKPRARKWIRRSSMAAITAGACLRDPHAPTRTLRFAAARRTTSFLSSFGEDEQGELYVVNLGGSVAVTAAPRCAWTAGSNASWITISGGATGTGNGTVTYAVAPYTGHPKYRNGTATIAGQTFSVKQSKCDCHSMRCHPWQREG
ncbi:MAG TPA: BACON domain-containing carbohydrate-binding protein [Casimicrobiaceae bacterium]